MNAPQQSLPDTIERTITIAASLDRVWDLISRPGWWINNGEVHDHEITLDGTVATVRDDELGTFRIGIVEARRPEYASYRWLSGNNDGDDAEPNNEQDDPANTLVEFFLAGTDGAVRVTVIESGWTAGPVTDKTRSDFAENEKGWDSELAAAQAFLERSSAGA